LVAIPQGLLVARGLRKGLKGTCGSLCEPLVYLRGGANTEAPQSPTRERDFPSENRAEGCAQILNLPKCRNFLKNLTFL
jgi:hypothetical protein